jgi:site-specific DNA-methyltransferase (cytosine-N4-specific)
MPESVRDRPTKAHEYIFLLSKSERYMYDADAIAEDTTDPEYRTNGKIRPTAEGGPGFEIRGGLHQQVGGRLTRNRRTVWTITTKPYPEAHFATFPPELPELCIKAGSKPGDAVLDPFAGAGTTLLTAKNLNRQAVGVELNPEYCRLIERRCAQGVLAL